MVSKRIVVALFVLLALAGSFLSFRLFAQNQSAMITFATQDSGYVFFDHNNARLYVYNARNGELATIWKINRLGQPLEQIR